MKLRRSFFFLSSKHVYHSFNEFHVFGNLRGIDFAFYGRPGNIHSNLN